ncbi:Protein of unknown function [Flavobacteriaceae bacterium MAR_2010_188]|nr:Protein of unknown function [Flavobacteriaceae bacterium MAR_2010_188]
MHGLFFLYSSLNFRSKLELITRPEDMTFHFKIPYFIGFVSILIIEILIAVYVSTGFLRHTVGDFLVVILLYFLLMSFIELKVITAAVIVLLVSFSIEFLQLFNLAKILKIEDNPIMYTILGSTFSINDLLAYLLGIATIIFFEKKLLKKF